MRVFNVTSMGAAIVLLAGLGAPSWGQGGAPAKPGAAQSLTGPGGKDVRDAAGGVKETPKQGEAVTKSDPKTHVNTLSPEEKRRAARARERAVSKGSSSKDASTKRVEEGTGSTPPASTAGAARPATGQAADVKPRVSAKENVRPRRSPVVEARRPMRMSRNRVAEPRWVPRVGSTVPRDVPLYRVPPGYRPGGFYVVRPPWRYAPGPGYPPFPRLGRAYPPFPHGGPDDEYFD